MKELAICVSEIQEKHLNEIRHMLNKLFARVNGLFTELQIKDQMYFLLAFDKDFEIDVKLQIVKIVAYVVREQCKSEFFKKRLKYRTHNDVNYTMLIKALCCFDNESDLDYIRKKLTYTSTINIISFYNFKLQDLRNKWSELVQVSNKNNGFLTYNETFFEIIRFVVASLEFQSESVKINERNNDYIITVNGNDEISVKKQDVASLLSEIIGANPKKICIEKADKEVIEYLMILFDQRVEII